MGSIFGSDPPQESKASRLARERQEAIAENELIGGVQADLFRTTRELRRRFGFASSAGGRAGGFGSFGSGIGRGGGSRGAVSY